MVLHRITVFFFKKFEMKKKTGRSLLEYGIFAAVALGLYLTGLHTEVIGFVQRGVLATGIMNPKVNQNPQEKEILFPEADFNFTLINSEGTGIDMDQFRGRVVFINVWATWCPPCVAEMPAIHKLYRKMKDEVKFIMLTVDEDFNKAIQYRDRKGYDFDIYRLASPLPSMYHSNSIPTTFVISADGRLALVHKGMADYGTRKFENFLRNLL